MTDLRRFRSFVHDMTRLIETTREDEERLFKDGKPLLGELVRNDDWLPQQFAQPDPDHYQQNLLYRDPMERFAILAVVWGPGQHTPIHDHTMWGMVGGMRGEELCEEYGFEDVSRRLVQKKEHLLVPGEVDLVSPRIGDIHRVSNAVKNGTSISIHVYGGNIGAVRRHIYEPESGNPQEFVSGYSSEVQLFDFPGALTTRSPERAGNNVSTQKADERFH